MIFLQKVDFYQFSSKTKQFEIINNNQNKG